MAEHQHDHASFDIAQDQGLIGLSFRVGTQDVTRYFADEAAADAAIPSSATDEALALAGTWSDLSWEDMEQGLDRIRHKSRPSPLIEV
jgi:hypothetical protein